MEAFGTIPVFVAVVENGGFSAAADHWTDYPGLAVDEEAIYVTANMFSFTTGFFGDTRLWIIEKGDGSGGLYDGGAATVSTALDPSTSFTFTLQPAHVSLWLRGDGKRPGNV